MERVCVAIVAVHPEIHLNVTAMVIKTELSCIKLEKFNSIITKPFDGESIYHTEAQI